MKTSEFVEKLNAAETASLADVDKKRFFSTMIPLIGNKKATQLWTLRWGILVSELEQTISEYPVLHKKQIIRLFEKETHTNKNDNIHGGRILRGLLIDIVYALEAYTGKQIARDSHAPLAYLEEACAPGEVITVEDFADFFSGRENNKLSRLKEKAQKTAVVC